MCTVLLHLPNAPCLAHTLRVVYHPHCAARQAPAPSPGPGTSGPGAHDVSVGGVAGGPAGIWGTRGNTRGGGGGGSGGGSRTAGDAGSSTTRPLGVCSKGGDQHCLVDLVVVLLFSPAHRSKCSCACMRASIYRHVHSPAAANTSDCDKCLLYGCSALHFAA